MSQVTHAGNTLPDKKNLMFTTVHYQEGTLPNVPCPNAKKTLMPHDDLPESAITSVHCAFPTEKGQIDASSCLAQLIYHGIFTTYPCHIIAIDADFIDAKKAISKMSLLNIPHPPCKVHIIQRNLEVSSWTKPLVEKTTSFGFDDNIGKKVCRLSLPSSKYTRQTLSTFKNH